MKKVLGFIAVLALVSGFASAETAFGDATDGGGSSTITSGDCSLLGGGVQLNLSANVFGGYDCDETNQDIKIATCHFAGSRAALDVTTTDPDTGETTTETITDYRAFTASSTGGSVEINALGGNCNSTNLLALEHFSAAE